MGLLHLSKSTVQVELPPIKMINIEREIIIFSTVAGVGQNIPATFGKAQKYVSKTKSICTLLSTVSHIRNQKSHLEKIIINVLLCYRSGPNTDPALRNSSLTMFFKGTQIRRGNFLNRRCGNCPNSWGTHNRVHFNIITTGK